jgi:hypothetical protein
MRCVKSGPVVDAGPFQAFTRNYRPPDALSWAGHHEIASWTSGSGRAPLAHHRQAIRETPRTADNRF